MAAPSPSTPPGMQPPLTVESDVDHSGLITIITAFAMFLTLGSLVIRVYSAYIRRTIQVDDWTFGATAVCSQSIGHQMDLGTDYGRLSLWFKHL